MSDLKGVGKSSGVKEGPQHEPEREFVGPILSPHYSNKAKGSSLHEQKESHTPPKSKKESLTLIQYSRSCI